jgi:hypothetical protein
MATSMAGYKCYLNSNLNCHLELSLSIQLNVRQRWWSAACNVGDADSDDSDGHVRRLSDPKAGADLLASPFFVMVHLLAGASDAGTAV